MAADSLRRLSSTLTEAAPALHEALAGCPDIPDQHAPEVFFQTVKAATDVSQPAVICAWHAASCILLCRKAASASSGIAA